MPGIPREFAEHSLQLFPDAKPVKQTIRRISGLKRTAVEAEVDRLLAAGFIREIKKSQWVADNPQEQGITVAPLNVEVRYRSAGARRKSYLFPTTKVSQVLVDYALNKFKEQGG